MTDHPSKPTGPTKSGPVLALFRSPVLWVFLVFDLRWITPVFDSVTWSNLWVYTLITVVSFVLLSGVAFVMDCMTANNRKNAGHGSLSLSIAQAVRLPFFAGAVTHYAAAFIFVPTAEGMFLWLAHGFGLLSVLMTRLFLGRVRE